MNVQSELATQAITPARGITASLTIMETGNARTLGLDIRKCYLDVETNKFKPTTKGVFLTQRELTFFLNVLGFKFEDITNHQVKAFFAEASEEMQMVGTA